MQLLKFEQRGSRLLASGRKIRCHLVCDCAAYIIGASSARSEGERVTDRRTAEQYLERAQELRTIADQFRDATTREALVRLAEEYEGIVSRIRSQAPPITH
jgi:hypothetical protein